MVLLRLDQTAFFTCQYYLEMSHLSVAFSALLPSRVAAACLYILNKVLRAADSWPSLAVLVTGYNKAEVRGTASELVRLIVKVKAANPNNNILRKFCKQRFLAVAESCRF